MCNDDTHLYDWKTIDSDIQIGDGKLLSAHKIEKLQLTVIQTSGAQQQIVLNEVQFVPDLAINLFSITKALDNG